MRRTFMLFTAVLGAVLVTTPVLAVDRDQLAMARQQLKHVVIIFQENRSFDSYFGTFPGAAGFPRDANGNITVCVPLDPSKPGKGCVKPFHDREFRNAGGPHGPQNFEPDLDHGKMDGFVWLQTTIKHCAIPNNPVCKADKKHDVMGYHTAKEIPNYWTYAQKFTLLDHLFQQQTGASISAHLYLLSEWSATCRHQYDPLSCYSSLAPAGHPYPWTNITYLLDRGGVSWKYYLAEGKEPDCDNGDVTCDPRVQKSRVERTWNPLPYFTYFAQRYAVDRSYWDRHLVPVDEYLRDIELRRLPTVSWIMPSDDVSEHPSKDLRYGMNYVTTLVNAIMTSDYWAHTVILISWDEWGGEYDHLPPPIADRDARGNVLGYGFRVPGLVISPFVRAGQIDHQTLSPDSYNRLIEDLFLGSQRLDPKTDGRPDRRPDVREALTTVTDYVTGKPIPVGDLLNDFDFHQTRLPPLVLPLMVIHRSPGPPG